MSAGVTTAVEAVILGVLAGSVFAYTPSSALA
jgi:hypothetical protein